MGRSKDLPHKRNLYAGAIVILLGLGTAPHASSYSIGVLGHIRWRRICYADHLVACWREL